jgi:hypothetical protein
MIAVLHSAPRTFPERKNPESKNSKRNNPNLFSGIYIIIPKIIPKGTKLGEVPKG